MYLGRGGRLRRPLLHHEKVTQNSARAKGAVNKPHLAKAVGRDLAVAEELQQRHREYRGHQHPSRKPPLVEEREARSSGVRARLLSMVV